MLGQGVSNSIKEMKVKDIFSLASIIYKDWDEEYKTT